MKRISVILAAMFILTCFLPMTPGAPSFEGEQNEAVANLAAPGFEAMVYLAIPADYYVTNTKMNITGMAAEGTMLAYPEGVRVLFNGTPVWAFNNTGYGPLGRQDEFSTGSNDAKIEFGAGGGSLNQRIRLPKDALVENATMDLKIVPIVNAIELINWTGKHVASWLGSSVSSAGDLNNDGYDDVIVGAQLENLSGDESGGAYIYFGNETMKKVEDVTLAGTAAQDSFGKSVSDAGDVNNDGYDDVIVGALYNDTGGTEAGQAYLFFGGKAMDSYPDLIFTGTDPDNYFGDSVSSAGDVNNDGYNDVIIGADRNDAGGDNAGRAYVFFGGKTMDNNPDVIMTGAAPYDFLGRLVSTAGDVNNDGFSDVIVGASYNDAGGNNAGSAYIYLGGPNMDGIADISLTGAAVDDFFGTVSSAGDVNNDGYDDVIVGASFNDAGGSDAGRAYIFYGGQNMDNIADVTFTGAGADYRLGCSVSDAGDINKDGYDDVIVGAFQRANYTGSAYVFLGGQNMDNKADFTFNGVFEEDWFGSSVSCAGDVNQDGYDEVVVGGKCCNVGGHNAGIACLYGINISNEGIVDPAIKLGSKTIWNATGQFNGTAALTDFAQTLNDYIRTASSSGTDTFGNSYIDVPLNVNAKSGGNITFFNLSIVYQYNATIPDFASTLNNYLKAHQGDKDGKGDISVHIRISSTTAGRVKLFGLNLTRDVAPTMVKEIKTSDLDEDSSNLTLIDLYPYFQDDADADTALNFSVVSSTNSSMVKLWISGKRYLSADAETGDANDNWTGTVQAVVACTDHWGQKTESNKFTIVIKNVNDAPVITSTPVLKAEADVWYFYNVTAIDGDNDVLHYNLTKAPPGMKIDSLTGKIQWMPRDKGYFEVEVEISDGNMTIHQNYFILLGNIAPVITSTPPLSAKTGELYVYNVTAEDSNNDALTFSLNSHVSGMVINEMTGQISWVPVIRGSFDVSVRVSDGKLRAEQNFTINVTQLNRAPRFVSTALSSAVAGGMPYQYFAKASDDDGDTLEFSLVSGPSGMTVESSNGKVSWTPASAGNFSVVLKVVDGKGGEALQEFTIVVIEKVKVKVEITRPAEKEKVKGKVVVAGTALKGTLEVVIVQVKIDDGVWINATGTSNWQFSLDTSKMKDGAHSLQARAFDGTDYSEVVNRTFSVDNKAPGSAKGFIPGLEGLMVVAVMVMILVTIRFRRKE